MNIKISKIHNSVKKILYNKLYILQIFVIYFQYITLQTQKHNTIKLTAVQYAAHKMLSRLRG